MFWGYATVMSWIASRLLPRRKIWGKRSIQIIQQPKHSSVQGTIENCQNGGRNPKDTLATQGLFYLLEFEG